MSVIEESLKLKEAIIDYQAKIPSLEEQITELTGVQAELDEEALEAEILEEKNWQKLKEKADENRKKIPELKAEIEKAERAIEILGEKQRRLRSEIMEEFTKKYRGEFAVLNFPEK